MNRYFIIILAVIPGLAAMRLEEQESKGVAFIQFPPWLNVVIYVVLPAAVVYTLQRFRLYWGLAFFLLGMYVYAGANLFLQIIPHPATDFSDVLYGLEDFAFLPFISMPAGLIIDWSLRVVRNFSARRKLLNR